jgi:nucleotide-binding universal stress UspA family protein
MSNILVPVDYSAVSDSAIRYSLAMARNTNSKFVFYHAGNSDMNKLKEHVQNTSPDVNFFSGRVTYVTGADTLTVDEVLKIIDMHSIDIIVMGTHGESTPLPPKLFGSNTSALIEHANVPVLAVPPSFIYKSITHIGYAADLAYLYEELEQVVDFAKKVSAAIEVVHVVPVFPDLSKVNGGDVNEIIEKVKNKHHFPYIKYFVEKTEHDNEIEKGIRNFLKKHSPDLLAVFHMNREWIDKVLDPGTSIKEVWHIRIPVIIFPKHK